jgi:NADPH:quinone reductase-like Zn-dependent oxidoreductase
VTAPIAAVVVDEPGRVPAVRPVDPPRAGAADVTIRVVAAPIAPLDLLCASGTSYFGAPATPYVPGVQGVGVVASGPATLPTGTPVWFATSAGMAPGDGSMRALATARESDVVPLPAGADAGLVAALGLSGVAAWMALTWRGGLAPGEDVLVLGAGGVVGQAAVQLARVAGARRVVAVARTIAARDRAERAGADVVVEARDDDDPDALARRIRDTAGEDPLDLVVDPLFGVPAAAALRVLRPHGRLVNFGSAAGETSPIDSSTLRSRSLRVLGYTNNELTAEQRGAALTRIVDESIAGRLRVAYEKAPLRAAADAWSRQLSGRVDGRIVLLPQEDA